MNNKGRITAYIGDKVKKSEKVLDKISEPMPVDDTENLCIHKNEDGNEAIVSIPDNEREG